MREPCSAVVAGLVFAMLFEGAAAGATRTLALATSEPSVATSFEESAPKEVAAGRFGLTPYVTRDRNGVHHYGGRFGIDMFLARGDRATRFASGFRFLLGGDGGPHFGPEGAIQLGIAHALGPHTVAALLAPLGFAMTMDGADGLEAHGVAGLEGSVVARGIDVGAGISTRGARAHAGIVRHGHEVGIGVGLEWQRDADTDLLGVYFATTPGD